MAEFFSILVLVSPAVWLTHPAVSISFLNEPAAVLNFWLWQFFGRLHPMIVHFPIALLIIALMMEFFTWRGKTTEVRSSIHVLLVVGAVSAIFSMLFGLSLQTQDQYSGDLIVIHQWAGIATAVLATVTAFLHRISVRRGKVFFLRWYRAALIFTVLAVTLAGHYGASLTHGADFLTAVLPWHNGDLPESNFDIAEFTSGKGGPLTDKQIADLNLEVRTIFAHNCYKCHSSAKIKGELRLDKRKFVMKGGKSGDVISAGHPEKSELIRRLLLPREDKEAMPSKGKALTEKEIATLQFWIRNGAPWPDNIDEKSVFRLAEMAPRRPDVPVEENGLANLIDRFVNIYFKDKKLEWKSAVGDRLYIRRVYLDIIGLLPSPEEVSAFVADGASDKREKLARQLLNRNDDYAQHWLTFWNDALRNDYTGTGYITGGRFAITDWLYESLRSNKPYDVFVRELISPDNRSQGFIRGIKWRGVVNASQRVEMQAAQNISQVFLGLNLKCASCHDSFVSDWKLKDAYAFANIFADSALEINRCDVPTGKMAETKILFSELGTIDSTASVDEKLKQLAEFLTAPKDGRLYRTIVNRIWGQLMGRGIVAPVDLMDNIPWSQDLLDWLASDFVENGKDLKDLIFKIVTSKTYQMPSMEVRSEDELVAEDYVFRGMERRRLSAEQFADAVSTIVFPIYPDTLRFFNPYKKEAAAPPVSYVRASLVKNDRFLTALGRPNRENVLTSRSSQANLLQALELTNGNRFNLALTAGARKWRNQFPSGRDLVVAVYQKALARNPNDDELKVALETLGTSPDDGAVEDFLWAIMLLPEFQLIY